MNTRLNNPNPNHVRHLADTERGMAQEQSIVRHSARAGVWHVVVEVRPFDVCAT